MQRVRTAKEQQSLYLEAELTAALRGIAEQHDTSISDVANELLWAAIRQQRSENVMLQRVRVLEEALPRDLVDPSSDHLVFGGREPVDVITGRKWDPSVYAPQ